jgi:hypothetical protein
VNVSITFQSIEARNSTGKIINPVGGIGGGSENTLERAEERCCRREGKNPAKNWRASQRKTTHRT